MAQVFPINSEPSSAQLLPSARGDDAPEAAATGVADVKSLPTVSNIDPEAAVEPSKYVDVSYMDILREFSILGFIAFGGPAAHIGLFQKVFGTYA